MRCYLPLVLAVMILVMSSLGCGKNHQLKGTITYKDGTPITTGMVNFDSGTSISRGKIQSDGSYTVGTLKDKDGIPKGTYSVYITGAEVGLESGKNQRVRVDSMGNPIPIMAGHRQLVDRKYMNASTTPIQCEVPAAKNRFDFIVEPPVY